MIQDIFPKKLDNHFRLGVTPGADAFVMHFTDEGVLFAPKKAFPRLGEVKGIEKLTYLFSIDEQKFFLCEDDAVDAPEEFTYRRIRELRRSNEVEREELFAIYTAKQLDAWYKNNRFCGRCGNVTGRSDQERAITCGRCGNIIYPRIVPAVIVAVIDRKEDPADDRILLTKYNGRGFNYYALIAGFTEIGETFEENVAREVMEEAGLTVKNIRYYKSQPWGVADDILAGFFCELDGNDQIRMDEIELSVAEWKRREEVVLQDDNMSLTNEMMTLFKEAREPR